MRVVITDTDHKGNMAALSLKHHGKLDSSDQKEIIKWNTLGGGWIDVRVSDDGGVVIGNDAFVIFMTEDVERRDIKANAGK